MADLDAIFAAVDFAVLGADDELLVTAADRATARAQLEAASAATEGEARQRVIDLLDAHADIAERTCRPGHLTGSAMVIDASRPAMLLLFHKKLQRWFQPGGHADGDTNLAAVALREAQEETGLENLRVVVPAIDVDIHEVDPPKEDAHLHLDVRFLVLAEPGSIPEGNHESEQLRWVALDDIDAYEPDDGLRRLAHAGFALAAHLGGN